MGLLRPRPLLERQARAESDDAPTAVELEQEEGRREELGLARPQGRDEIWTTTRRGRTTFTVRWKTVCKKRVRVKTKMARWCSASKGETLTMALEQHRTTTNDTKLEICSKVPYCSALGSRSGIGGCGGAHLTFSTLESCTLGYARRRVM